jgi:hypothetical protein
MTRCALLLIMALSAAPLRAMPVFILQPTPQYTSETTLLQITDPEGSIITSVSDSVLIISFLSGGSALLMDVNAVPSSWATWGSPPNTESSTPTVVRSDDPSVTTVLFQFSVPLTTFGLELEPDDTSAVHDITATFLYNGNTLGVLQRSVDGNGGALLFAAAGGVFDSVSVSSDVDFAAAEFRYTAVPEPSSRSFIILGGLLVGLSCLRRARKNAMEFGGAGFLPERSNLLSFPHLSVRREYRQFDIHETKEDK